MKNPLSRLWQSYGSIFRQWPTLGLVMVTVFLAELAYAIIIPTLPLHLKNEMNAPVVGIGLVFATFALVETLFKTPAGAVSDRHGRLRIILLGLLLGTISPLLMTVVRLWELFIPLRVLDGMAVAAVWPAMMALISERVRPQDKATALAAFNLAWISGVGLGPAVGLEIGHRFGSNIYAFYASSVLLFCAALLALAIWWTNREPRLHPSSQNPDEAPNAATPSQPRSWLTRLRQLRDRRPVLLHMLWILALIQVGLTILLPVLPLYAQTVLGMTQHQMSQAFLGPIIVVAALALPLGRLSDRIGRDRAIHLALPLAAVALLVIPSVQQIWMLIAMAAVIGICFDLATPSWLALTSQLAPAHRQGLALGAMNTAQGLGFIIGPVLGAALYGYVSVTAPFWAAGLILGAAAAAAILLVRAPREEGNTNAMGIVSNQRKRSRKSP